MPDVAPESGPPLHPLPRFLQPTTSLDLSRKLSGVVEWALGSVFKSRFVAAGGRLKHSFLLEKQDQTNWCWASVAVAVNGFLRQPAVSQCQVAQRTRKPVGVSCCQSPGADSCNKPELISKALAAVGVARLSSPEQPQNELDVEVIRHDIGRNRPIICAMGGGGTNHFVVVVAWAVIDGVPWIFVDDPAVGARRERSLGSFMADLDGRRFIQATRLQ